MQEVGWIQAVAIPESDLTVLVHTPDADEPVQVGFHDGESWCDYNGAELTGRNQVVHWMPLPDPPGEQPSPAKESHSQFAGPGFCGSAPPCKGSTKDVHGCTFDCVYNENF